MAHVLSAAMRLNGSGGGGSGQALTTLDNHVVLAVDGEVLLRAVVKTGKRLGIM